MWWWMLTRFLVVTMSQYIHISNYYVVHLKRIWCYMSIIPRFETKRKEETKPLTPWSWTSGFQNYEKMSIYCLSQKRKVQQGLFRLKLWSILAVWATLSSSLIHQAHPYSFSSQIQHPSQEAFPTVLGGVPWHPVRCSSNVFWGTLHMNQQNAPSIVKALQRQEKYVLFTPLFTRSRALSHCILSKDDSPSLLQPLNIYERLLWVREEPEWGKSHKSLMSAESVSALSLVIGRFAFKIQLASRKYPMWLLRIGLKQTSIFEPSFRMPGEETPLLPKALMSVRSFSNTVHLNLQK